MESTLNNFNIQGQPTLPPQQQDTRDLETVLHENWQENEFGALVNPLLDTTEHKVAELGRQFALDYGFGVEHQTLFEKGAILARRPDAWEDPEDPNSVFRSQSDADIRDDINSLQAERAERWYHLRKVYPVILVSGGAAAAQGWSQVAANPGEYST